MKTEGIERSERRRKHKKLVVNGSVKNPRKSKESSPLPLFRTIVAIVNKKNKPALKPHSV